MPFEIAPRRALATFRLGLPPGEVFEHQSWRAATDAALAAIAGGGRVLVLGAPGTGKSLLLHTLRGRLEGEGREVRLVRHGALLPPPDDPAPILVDEACTIDHATLADLLARPNPLVLAGLEDFAGAVDAALPEGAPALPTVTLAPLDPVELARFVAERLAAVDRQPDFFASGAVAALAARSGGLFRSAVLLAGSAMFFAQMRGSSRVGAADVEDAAAMRASLLAGADSPLAPTIRDPAAATLSAPAPPDRPLDSAPGARRRPIPARIVGAGFGVTLLAALLVLAVGLTRPAPPSSLPPAAPQAAPAPLPPTPAEPAASVSAPLSGSPVASPLTPSVPSPSTRTPSLAPAPVPAPPQAAPGRLLAPAAYRGTLPIDPAEPAPEILLRLRNQAEDGATGAITGTVRDLATGGVGRLRGTLAADGAFQLTGKLLLARREYAATLRGRIEDRQLTADAALVRGRDGPRTAALALRRE